MQCDNQQQIKKTVCRSETSKSLGLQNHVDSRWFDKYDNWIESSSVQSLDGIAADIQDTMLAL